MRSIFWRVSGALVGLAVALGAFAGPTAGEIRNRALERVIMKSGLDAAEGARLQPAFAAALQAGVEERSALTLVGICVENEFETSQVLRLLSIVSQLALEQLPVDGFISKVEEGVSKRVSPDRIVQAAERRALMLNKAKQILNALVLQGATIADRDELLPDLAAALEAGRSPDEARRILSASFEAGESVGRIRGKLFP